MPESPSITRELHVHSHGQRRRLHVVHGVLSLDVGGLERIVLDLVDEHQKHGHDVSVVCVERSGALAHTAEQLGGKVISLDKPTGRHSATVGKAAAVLSGLGANVIHTHQLGALWYLGQAARKLGIPVLHTEHGNHLAQSQKRLRRLKTRVLMHRAARLASRFCCVSEEIAHAARRYRTVPRGKIEVVPNGIRTQTFGDRSQAPAVRESLGIPTTAPVVGTVGRLSAVKRQDVLLHGFAQVKAAISDAHLIVVGEGPCRPDLEKLADRLGISQAVHFVGRQLRPEIYLSALDVFALTSQSEGMPVSLLEAWDSGVPVVASRVGGIAEVVEHGVSGLHFDFPDATQFARCVATLLSDRPRARTLGSCGQRLVRERFDIANTFAQYWRLYEHIRSEREEAGKCASSC